MSPPSSANTITPVACSPTADSASPSRMALIWRSRSTSVPPLRGLRLRRSRNTRPWQCLAGVYRAGNCLLGTPPRETDPCHLPAQQPRYSRTLQPARGRAMPRTRLLLCERRAYPFKTRSPRGAGGTAIAAMCAARTPRIHDPFGVPGGEIQEFRAARFRPKIRDFRATAAHAKRSPAGDLAVP